MTGLVVGSEVVPVEMTGVALLTAAKSVVFDACTSEATGLGRRGFREPEIGVLVSHRSHCRNRNLGELNLSDACCAVLVLRFSILAEEFCATFLHDQPGIK